MKIINTVLSLTLTLGIREMGFPKTIIYERTFDDGTNVCPVTFNTHAHMFAYSTEIFGEFRTKTRKLQLMTNVTFIADLEFALGKDLAAKECTAILLQEIAYELREISARQIMLGD